MLLANKSNTEGSPEFNSECCIALRLSPKAAREATRQEAGRKRVEEIRRYREALAASPLQVLGRGPRWSKRQLADMDEDES